MKSLRLAWRLIFFLCYTAYIVREIRLKKALLNIDLRGAMRVRSALARTLPARRGRAHRRDRHAARFSLHHRQQPPLLSRSHPAPAPHRRLPRGQGRTLQMAGDRRRATRGHPYLQREQQGNRLQTLRQMEEKIKDGFRSLFTEGTTSGYPAVQKACSR
ncbi:MAG: hypothetical protein R2791_01545 [Saprospiraceae bacterium]